MVDEGVDIIDVGACSSRPGSSYPGEEEEWRRLEPVLKIIRDEYKISVSIDTFRSEIVQRAFDTIGSFIVNDIYAGEGDPGLLPLVGQLHLPYIATHMRGTPETMQEFCQYDDVVREVSDYFIKFENKAAMYGISEWIMDPGFGFAKNLQQNYEMMKRLGEFKRPGHLLLVGISRKGMIYKPLGITPENALSATSSLHLYAIMHGADILRVHDVAEAVQCVKLYELLNN